MAANFFKAIKSAKAQKEDSLTGSSASQPWVEKYRPRTIAEVSSQTQVVQVLRRTIESQNLPHLLFYGPPGTGKTSTILALAKDLFGTEHYKSRILELNASDERGINVIREKVKNFARAIVTNPTETSHPNMPPYKIIILDEADSMTPDAQAALRRVMENYSKITRFCLICNYVTRIIEPLASRCAKFRFMPLESHDIKARLNMISEKEGLQIDDDAVDTIIEVAEGDLRKAIMFLQSSGRLAGRSGTVTAPMILDLGGVVPHATIDSLFNLWHQGKTLQFDQVRSAVDDITTGGYAASQIVAQLYTALLKDPLVGSVQKAKLARVFSDIDHHLTHGADEYLQLMRLMLEGCRVSALPSA